MAEDNLVGRTVAGYHLIDCVGEGGTATVYRAQHPERGMAAVKILRSRLAQDPVAVKRFFREAEYGKRIEHPNIVRTYDYGDAEGLQYLALEWVEGESLADFLAGAGQLAPPLVARIIGQLGAALAVSHDEGIIHRDLKPANIMYNPTRQEAKLLDWGIARDADTTEERLTRTGFFVGTLQYVAPEALSGELVTSQADVYSLATIAYHLLVGQLPFAGKGPRELFQQLLTESPLPLNQARKDLQFPAEVERAVMHGLERSPAKRPQSTDEFARRFAAAIEAGEIQRSKGLLGRLFGRSSS